MWVDYWTGVTYLRYTVLTSRNKSKTAVHCYDPALSVLVMLVSRNVFHVVSALQSIVYAVKVGARKQNCHTLLDKFIDYSSWIKNLLQVILVCCIALYF